MNTDTTDYRFECIVNLKFILLSVIFSVTVETASFSAVFTLLSVIFSYSGNGLVQCLYYYRLYSVTVETVSFSVYIIIGYIQCYSGNGLVQCGVGGS